MSKSSKKRTGARNSVFDAEEKPAARPLPARRYEICRQEDRRPDARSGRKRDLLEIFDDRYDKSASITSQLDLKQWHAYIDDPTLADAILDLPQLGSGSAAPITINFEVNNSIHSHSALRSSCLRFAAGATTRPRKSRYMAAGYALPRRPI